LLWSLDRPFGARSTVSGSCYSYYMNEYETLEIMSEYEAKDNYDAFLNDCYEVVTVGYSEFYPSDILKNCDPIAYRCGFADYVDSLSEEGIQVEGYC